MAKRNVVWTRTADLQFVGILEFWAVRNHSNRYSKRLLKQVSKRIKLISNSPFLYRQTDFEGVRISVLKNYSILYKVEPERIIVIAFWDNRQDYARLLKMIKSARSL